MPLVQEGRVLSEDDDDEAVMTMDSCCLEASCCMDVVGRSRSLAIATLNEWIALDSSLPARSSLSLSTTPTQPITGRSLSVFLV